MSEKQNEVSLAKSLEKGGFHLKNTFYNPNEHDKLASIFRCCSKKNSNMRGIPDRLYFDEECNLLMVFECKPKSLNEAVKDLQFYRTKMIIEPFDCNFHETNHNIYLRSFVQDNKTSTQTVTMDYKKKMHTLHNYIRENTKISNEDKPYFIAIILISLKKETFRLLIKAYDFKSNKFIYDILKENLQDFDIDTSIFEYLRNDKNNAHFLNIINMCIEIVDNIHENIDVLNEFYTEFTSYYNNDSKELGIVLTPPHIVRLMARLLNIQHHDIILDLCTGTGSFLLECSKYQPLKLIGCEYQNKLYNLLKCNLILKNINNYEIFFKDCFENRFTATKSIINPPYGMQDKKELDFILKQLESVVENGLVCAILPLAKINSNSKTRKEIAKIGKIRSIIKCNSNLFYPSASIQCVIVLIEKCSQGHDYSKDLVSYVDYTDDGFEMKRGSGRIIQDTSEFENKFNNIFTNENKYLLEETEDWIKATIETEEIIDKKTLQSKLLEIQFHSEKLKLENEDTSIQTNTTKFHRYKIDEIFDVLKQPIEEYNVVDKKKVHVISAKNNNNGIKEISVCNKKTFTGNKIVLVTGGNGGAGLAFYQKDDFNITSATIVLSPKISKLLFNEKIGVYCAMQLSKYKNKYSRGLQWNENRIKNDYISLPITDNSSIDYDFIQKCFV